MARGRAGVLLAALQDRSERREDGPELPLRPDAGLAQPAIVRTRGVLRCESERESMSVAAGVWWRDVLGGIIRGLGGYCSGGASREASSCGGKGLCLFASVRSVIEYTALKVIGKARGRKKFPSREGQWCGKNATLHGCCLPRTV